MKKILHTFVSLAMLFSFGFALPVAAKDYTTPYYEVPLYPEEPDPFINEPGYEVTINNFKEEGDRLLTIRLQQIQEFRKGVKLHPQGKNQTLWGENVYGYTRTQHTALTRSLNAQEQKLKKIKTDLQNATDIPTARAAVNAIFAERAWSVFRPKFELQEALYRVNNRVPHVRDYLDAQNNFLRRTRARGYTVTERTAAVQAGYATLTRVRAKITVALNTLAMLKPSDYGTVSEQKLREANKTVNDAAAELDGVLNEVMDAFKNERP